MNEQEELFDKLDQEILSCIPAMKYAQENISRIIDLAYKNTVRKVYTTQGYELGIVCPSLVNHRVIGGNKKGRVIKTIPEKENYCEIGYDSSDKPLYFKNINEFGTEFTDFIFEYGGYTWAMDMELYGQGELSREVKPHRIKKYSYDKQNRIQFYAQIDAPHNDSAISSSFGFGIFNYYEYYDDTEKPIICHFYHYAAYVRTPTNERDVRQFSEYLYEISSDMKNIKAYIKKDGEYIFSREIKSGGNKSNKPKPAADSYDRFSEWLDSELDKRIPEKGGVYFDLFEPSEDGFGIYFCITKYFDKDDDWACNVEYSSETMFTVCTNGAMEWKNALDTAAKMIKKYLRNGNNCMLLNKYAGIGVGFPDSDIVYLR